MKPIRSLFLLIIFFVTISCKKNAEEFNQLSFKVDGLLKEAQSHGTTVTFQGNVYYFDAEVSETEWLRFKIVKGIDGQPLLYDIRYAAKVSDADLLYQETIGNLQLSAQGETLKGTFDCILRNRREETISLEGSFAVRPSMD
ncbi:hypothetical protein [Pedobacter sp. SYSU D00535]|uniref:hypothetical protein n=1 Tax=Pedobacter sp. SYSU D00535 TaxID=2810308 RepID=UPI001A959897|nr:hypothetical protein [Pedobacter sp. SYSU D00535]